MSTKKKLLLGSAGAAAAGGDTTDITDVFSTFVYDGNGATQVIENGIALGNAGDGGSGNFTASSTTRINVAASSNFGFGTGDFTIEFFVYLYSQYNYSEFYDQRTSSQDATTLSPIIYGDSSGRVYFYATDNRIQSNINATPVGAWTHVAVTRASGSTKLFINGTQQGSTYSDSNNYVTPASDFSFGGSLERNNYNVDGLMSNLRVVKGTAVYTSNFTAPTAALTAVSGTSLLTLQGSTPFVDNSGNNVTLTQNGSPTASGFGPFTGTSGEGGLVWTKRRGDAVHHVLYDTARGATKRLFSSLTSAETTETNGLTSFNSNGFTVGSAAAENNNGSEIVSWTWRKAPKFFTCLTYSGTGSAKNISHDLDAEVGFIMVKRLDSTSTWRCWHRGLPSGNNVIHINETGAYETNSDIWNGTAPTSTQFSVGTNNNVNASGGSYVAYLFAHNDGDGEFGPDADQDIIKCGSYTGNGSTTGPEINLGFEPQWLLIKRISGGTANWFLVDTMRGLPVGSNSNALFPNSTNAEDTAAAAIDILPTGFQPKASSIYINASSSDYIYMAIRRGPLAEPTSATDVFNVLKETSATLNQSPPYLQQTGFPVDVVSNKLFGGTSSWWTATRLTDARMQLQQTAAEASVSTTHEFDHNDGVAVNGLSGSTNFMGYHWRRAPSYFDVVAFELGTNANREVKHNLSATPEMIWWKKRNAVSNWAVFHKDLGQSKYLTLQDTSAEATSSDIWGTSSFSSTAFYLKESSFGSSGDDCIAYLFATVAGVSKVGSYTGTGAQQNIDCGFSSGARFVLIKRSSGTGHWRLMDSERGIVSGVDKTLLLNTTNAETTDEDTIDPHSSGFSVPNNADVNASGSTYIFYAIA